MSKTTWVEDTLTLCGTEIAVRNGRLPQAELLFYPENPRLYSIVHATDDEPSQEAIEKKLATMEHVKQLVQSIRANGGLTDPLIVRDKDNVVLEGNSRLAAYRLLARNDPIKWGKVKCKVLPKETSEAMVFALLGEYHIIGKKDWAPYEQAGYLYRRHTVHGITATQMAQEMGISATMIGRLIKVYTFMVTHKDNDVGRWSYYEEYLKHNCIRKARELRPELDSIVVRKITSGEIPRAVDVRDKLTKVATAGGKVLKAFVSEEGNFEQCYERAIARGADNVWYKRLKKFRGQVADDETQSDLLDMADSHRKKCIFELKKINQAVETLLRNIQ